MEVDTQLLAKLINDASMKYDGISFAQNMEVMCDFVEKMRKVDHTMSDERFTMNKDIVRASLLWFIKMAKEYEVWDKGVKIKYDIPTDEEVTS